MKIYLVIFTCLMLFSILEIATKKNNEIKNNNNILLINDKPYLFLLFLLTIFVGFRDKTGGDWYHHLQFYNDLNFVGIQKIFIGEYLEKPLYTILNLVSVKLNLGFNFYLYTASILFIYCLGIFCNYFIYKYTALFISFPIIIVVIGMGFVSQSLALGFFCLSLIYLLKRNLFKSIFFLIFGALFHKSLIVLFPLLLITYFNNFKKKFMILSLIFVIMILFSKEYFLSMIENYIEDDLVSAGTIFRLMISFFPICLYFFIDKNNFSIIKRKLIILLILVIILLMVLSFFLKPYTAIDRIGLYISILQIILYCEFLKIIKEFKFKILLGSSIYCIYWIYFLIWLFKSLHAFYWIPYGNILF